MIANCKRRKGSSACRLEIFQADRTDARSWFGMNVAKETPAWRATPAVRFRRQAGNRP